jgi:hypothetical protein
MQPYENYAVANKRHDKKDNVSDFPTPCWATRALMAYVLNNINSQELIAWEPSCNRGYMVKPLREFFAHVVATDLHDYGQNLKLDFLTVSKAEIPHPVHWIVSNPPYHIAQDFIMKALEISDMGVAMLVRTNFLEGQKRFNQLFRYLPPTVIAQFVERVPMVKGRYDPKASTATSYAWLVWDKRVEPRLPTFFWIPPCRKSLERETDWPENQDT